MTDYLDNIFLTKVYLVNYVRGKCLSDTSLQLSFKFFAKLCVIIEFSRSKGGQPIDVKVQALCLFALEGKWVWC